MDLGPYLVKIGGEMHGTGCKVGPRLVLTAMHCVSADYFCNRETSQAPQVTIDGQPAKLVWPTLPVASTANDLALVQISEKVWAFEDWLDVDGDWPIGVGFNSDGWPASAGGRVPVSGTLHRHGDDGGLERLNCTGAVVPDHSEHWPGISGAPVVVMGRVRGVIIHRVKGWRSLLDAAPVRLGLEDAAFCKLVPRVEHDRRLADRVCRAVADSDLWNAMSVAAGCNDREALSEFLLRGKVVPALERIEKAHVSAVDRAVDSNDAKARTLAVRLFDLMGLVVACRAPVVEPTEEGALRVTAATITAVEFAAARRDHRGVSYEKVEVEKNPTPKNARPAAPDNGRLSSAPLRADLCAKFDLPNDTPIEVVNRLVAHLRPDQPVYFVLDAKRIVGCEGDLRAAVRELSSVPFFLRSIDANSDVAFEGGVLAALKRLYLTHQRLHPR